MPAITLPDLARLALDRVAEDERRDARVTRHGGGGLERHLRRRDHDRSRARQPRSPGLGRLILGALEMRSAAGGSVMPYRASDRAGIGESWWHPATVGPEAMTAGSSPGHVGDDQRDDLRRIRGRGEPPTLDRGEVLAHAVHLADMRARAQQRAIDRLLVLEGEARRRAG